MTSKEIRGKFLKFFESKGHLIVPSAPIVVKNDPTLMFINAGMNPFKDIFLGNSSAGDDTRVTDTQKCLRVSGKHNDLEEVGVDTYHHTMFEMLGNWSFGDYFKEEAIAWAWELLTEVYSIPKDRIYVTIFEGDKKDGVPIDQEAENFWKQHIDPDRIIPASKKDNFWEMGDTGPCGPCSEIHVDIRSDEERAKVDGKSLVNQDHPQVIEIWNLVFIQFNRKSDGSLESLPSKHVDTGMGFERLCMVLQGKQSNYDTDVFMPIIERIEKITRHQYGKQEKTDIAMRVIADHLRAVTFATADGQRPSNTGAGYVIRRILRRAVRYAYTHLDYKEPILHQLLEVLVEQFVELFPDLEKQYDSIAQTILAEEKSFLRTLGGGVKRFQAIQKQLADESKNTIDGKTAFELYDTYGFPIDLTRLMAAENGLGVDEAGFDKAMNAQKERARADRKVDAEDWVELIDTTDHSKFVGYDQLEAEAKVIKYRKVTQKKKTLYQMVLDTTPFYAESGGQVGDKGMLHFGDEVIHVVDTRKENDLFVHFTTALPSDVSQPCVAQVNSKKRSDTTKNHTATHLLHAALRDVLGDHVHQKGSLVNPDYLRFDFSHSQKIDDEQLRLIEEQVNARIRQNIALEELRDVPIDQAMEMGAMALFGEKYGDEVRVIIFDKDFSVELCGGTHVKQTGALGYCRITTETSVAAGVRRIEAVTGRNAQLQLSNDFEALTQIRRLFKNPKDILASVNGLIEERDGLVKEIDRLHMSAASQIKDQIKGKAEQVGQIAFIAQQVEVNNADMVKKIAYELRNEVDNLFLVLGADLNGKAHLTLMFSDNLVEQHGLNAGKLIRDLAKHMQGGGGGQAFYASAGGKKPAGIPAAIAAAKEVVQNLG